MPRLWRSRVFATKPMAMPWAIPLCGIAPPVLLNFVAPAVLDSERLSYENEQRYLPWHRIENRWLSLGDVESMRNRLSSDSSQAFAE